MGPKKGAGPLKLLRGPGIAGAIPRPNGCGPTPENDLIVPAGAGPATAGGVRAPGGIAWRLGQLWLRSVPAPGHTPTGFRSPIVAPKSSSGVASRSPAKKSFRHTANTKPSLNSVSRDT